jgi:hypothetical protein
MTRIVAQRIMPGMSLSRSDFSVLDFGHNTRRRILTACMVVAAWGGLTACTPALNWREVRFDNARWVGWLPCKPDRAQRTVDLGGHAAQLSLMGCQADDMDFTLAQLSLPVSLSAVQAQQAWKTASLSSLQAPAEVPSQDWVLAGASPDLKPQRVMAQGGQGQSARWAWFAYDGQLYQAAVYSRAARSVQAEQAMESLLSGLRLP